MTLHQYMRLEGLSQKAFAERIGVTQQAVQRYLDGRVPKAVIARRIVAETNGQVGAADLLGIGELDPVVP